MEFIAKILSVTKGDDNVTIKVEFSNGEKSFEKDYPLVMVADFENSVKLTIINETKRINDLEMAYSNLKALEGTLVTE